MLCSGGREAKFFWCRKQLSFFIVALFIYRVNKSVGKLNQFGMFNQLVRLVSPRVSGDVAPVICARRIGRFTT